MSIRIPSSLECLASTHFRSEFGLDSALRTESDRNPEWNSLWRLAPIRQLNLDFHHHDGSFDLEIGHFWPFQGKSEILFRGFHSPLGASELEKGSPRPKGAFFRDRKSGKKLSKKGTVKNTNFVASAIHAIPTTDSGCWHHVNSDFVKLGSILSLI